MNALSSSMRAVSTNASTLAAGTGGEWRPSAGSGVTMKVLWANHETGEGRALLRFGAGARFPAHNHPGGEQVLVLEGEVRIGRHRLRTGDYLFTPPDVVHAASSAGGCLLFVTAPKPIEIIRRKRQTQRT